MVGLSNAFESFFTFAIICFFVAIVGVSYTLYSISQDAWGDKEIVSPKVIVPELKLTINGNKVDTLFVYKLKR